MAINGVTLIGKSLTEATKLLQTAGDLVTLKVARPDKSLPSKLPSVLLYSEEHCLGKIKPLDRKSCGTIILFSQKHILWDLEDLKTYQDK